MVIFHSYVKLPEGMLKCSNPIFSKDRATNRLHNVATCRDQTKYQRYIHYVYIYIYIHQYPTISPLYIHYLPLFNHFFSPRWDPSQDRFPASFPAISAWGSRRNKQKESTNVDTQYSRRAQAACQGVQGVQGEPPLFDGFER